nr:Aminoglycoside N(3)-acetyltransferase [Escherichia coli]
MLTKLVAIEKVSGFAQCYLFDAQDIDVRRHLDSEPSDRAPHEAVGSCEPSVEAVDNLINDLAPERRRRCSCASAFQIADLDPEKSFVVKETVPCQRAHQVPCGGTYDRAVGFEEYCRTSSSHDACTDFD